MIPEMMKKTLVSALDTMPQDDNRKALLLEYYSYCLEKHDMEAMKAVADQKGLRIRCIIDPQLNPQLRADMFGEIPHATPAYLKQILWGPGCGFRNCALSANNVSSKYVNVTDGIRRTTGQPEKAERTVHFIGSSRIFSLHSEDAHTISSFFQQALNERDGGRSSVRAVNYGTLGQFLPNHFLRFERLETNPGDMLVIDPRNQPSSEDDPLFPTFLALREICRQRDVSLHVVLMPRCMHVFKPTWRERVLLIRKPKLAPPAEIRERYANCAGLLERNGIRCHDLSGLFDRPHDMGEIFIDRTHNAHRGNKRIALAIFERIFNESPRKPQPETGEASAEARAIKADEIISTARRASIQWLGEAARKHYAKQEDVVQWLAAARQPAFEGRKNIGAIVMNCNPFTFGHQFLVETAAAMVDGLYIFVVEEDLSDFPFADRLMLVKRGVAGLGDAVHVVPSGRFIISSMSFPGYFTKKKAIKAADSTTDVLIFGSVLAPALGITRRFVGEEPNCLVTDEYNRTMTYLLPKLGVDVSVIPRKERDGQPISASLVRECLNNGDRETVKRLVPETTFQYLVDSGRFHEK